MIDESVEGQVGHPQSTGHYKMSSSDNLKNTIMLIIYIPLWLHYLAAYLYTLKSMDAYCSSGQCDIKELSLV